MKAKTAYNLLAAISMMEKKKGAGIRKKTRVLINIQINEGITETKAKLSAIKGVLEILKVPYQSKVTTEIENNPDWEK